jgi:hypothetical protein
MPVPQLSAEQRRLAFERSLELRRQRSNLKYSLADKVYGKARLIAAFGEECAQGMKVIDLLASLHAVGPLKAERYLELAGIPLKNTVRACGPKQRERLFNLLR